MPIQTSSQTIGPYWHLLEEPEWADLTRWGAEGEGKWNLDLGDIDPVQRWYVDLWKWIPGSHIDERARQDPGELGASLHALLRPYDFLQGQLGSNPGAAAAVTGGRGNGDLAHPTGNGRARQ